MMVQEPYASNIVSQRQDKTKASFFKTRSQQKKKKLIKQQNKREYAKKGSFWSQGTWKFALPVANPCDQQVLYPKSFCCTKSSKILWHTQSPTKYV